MIEGEIFIVTRGGSNIPLGLVDVAAIEDDRFVEAFKKSMELYEFQHQQLKDKEAKRRDRINERKVREAKLWEDVVNEGKSKMLSDFFGKQDFRYGIPEIKHDRASANRVLSDIHDFISLNYEQRNRKRTEVGRTNEFYYQPSISRWQMHSMRIYYSNIMDIERETRLLEEKELKELREFLKGEFLLGPIARENSTIQTNSKGAFQLKLKKNRDYYIIAVGSRNIGEMREVYLWSVPLKKGKNNISSFFLSNDNITTSESIIQLYKSKLDEQV